MDTHSILLVIKKCLLPKLSKEYHETENHPEFELWRTNLDLYFKDLMCYLGEVDYKENSYATINLVAYVLILYEELKIEDTWNTDHCKQLSRKLDCTFDIVCGVSLSNLLASNFFNAQTIFEESMKILHGIIDSSNYKKYPGLTGVYSTLVQQANELHIRLNPVTTLPISLNLIDDFVNTNKLKGLQNCSEILSCLNSSDFQGGNYYEVIYISLKNSIHEKDLEVTRQILNCFLKLLTILPQNVKYSKTDEVYAMVLDQLNVEANILRKSELFKFLKNIIVMHGASCMNRKIIKTIFYDSLDACSNDVVADTLLSDILECLDVWIQYCWCVWQFSKDYMLISILLKVLLVCKKDYITKIHDLIVALINLCKQEERKQICHNFETSMNDINNSDFLQRVNEIKAEICI